MANEPKKPKTEPDYMDSQVDQGFSNPMLEKIRRLLTSTEPEKWKVGGKDLTPDFRSERPRTAYHQVLVREIPNGSLVLHMTQPVTSQYQPGGYALIPSSLPEYTVEIRDRIFDANKAVDPRYADNQRGKRCDVIAGGEIAKSLFFQVRETIRGFNKDRKQTFDEKTRELLENLPDRIAETSIEEWEKIKEPKEDGEDIRYVSEMEGIRVEIGRRVKDWESNFRVVITEELFVCERAGAGLARACYQKLEEMEQNAQLSILGETLKGLGFDDDDGGKGKK